MAMHAAAERLATCRVQATMELFVRQLVRRMALRLADDLEPRRLRSADDAKRKLKDAPGAPYSGPRTA